MRKIIFLDIDGVIATPENTLPDESWGLVDSKQDLLGDILDQTGAEIVLSSSWRKNDLKSTRTRMKNEGFRFWDKIVGITIRGHHYIEKGFHMRIYRGTEIKQWIDVNLMMPWIGNKYDSVVQRLEALNKTPNMLGLDYIYVILDDNANMLLEQKNYFVQCNSDTGLTEVEVKKCIKILNNVP